MRPSFLLLLLLLLLLSPLPAAEPDFPLTGDSKPNANAPKGELIKGSHTAKEGEPFGSIDRKETLTSVFPGTERDYTLYLPPGFDKSKPAAFMVFQDGVIYQAPTVFDNLIAKKEIPPLVGIFVKPGVVPAPNDNALPRFNRSYEYDSITDNYARFLIDELLPAIEETHNIKLSTDPNYAAISGNSSGGIAAFMVAWHRPDRFRRVFTGVGTYVGIHGGDRLPVLVRKIEPKPIKIFLQSGTGDNNLYCGDWWMANQMMERSLTWAGYDVNHAWGEGGHNQKHASQIFPDVLRWLWKGWPEAKEVKANPRGTSKWRGYEVLTSDDWRVLCERPNDDRSGGLQHLTPFADGSLFLVRHQRTSDDGSDWKSFLVRFDLEGKQTQLPTPMPYIQAMAAAPGNKLRLVVRDPKMDSLPSKIIAVNAKGEEVDKPIIATQGTMNDRPMAHELCFAYDGRGFFTDQTEAMIFWSTPDGKTGDLRSDATGVLGSGNSICLSPDQSLLYATGYGRDGTISVFHTRQSEPLLRGGQPFDQLEFNLRDGPSVSARSVCVDAEGRLYVATSLGIQVCDQAGRVNFIIPTPRYVTGICFGGKDLSELFINCGGTIYKRKTKVHGIVSGQMPPIKPAAPKL